MAHPRHTTWRVRQRTVADTERWGRKAAGLRRVRAAGERWRSAWGHELWKGAARSECSDTVAELPKLLKGRFGRLIELPRFHHTFRFAEFI